MGERKHGEPKLDNVFLALGHPTRRRMLGMLQARPYGVTELAGSFDLSLNVVSKHLKYLERAGLLRREREGKLHRLSGNAAALTPATRWLERHLRLWQGALDSFGTFIAQTSPHPQPRLPCPRPRPRRA